MKGLRSIFVCIFFAMTAVGPAIAQEKSVPREDLSKELADANSALSKLQIKHTITGYEGTLPDADEQIGNLTLFQPIFPFPLTDDSSVNFFFRPAFPVIWEQPIFRAAEGGFDDELGFGDVGFDVALGKSWKSLGLSLIGGMKGTLPTGTDSDLTGGQLRLGPELAVSYGNEDGILVLFPQHEWNVTGWRDDQYNTSTLEIFAAAFLGDNWTVGSDPKMNYDWVEDEWEIPVNGLIRKIVHIGDLPIQLQVDADYFVKNDDNFGRDWAVTFTVAPIIPNPFLDLF